MPYEFPKAFFVTGTDTGVGKTVICAILMSGLNAAYWKPVQSGTAEKTDTRWIKDVTRLPDDRFMQEAWRLSLPLSPHAAAERDGVRIDISDFKLPMPESADHLIVEGAGGILVPLNERSLMIDLIRHFGFPVLLVARSTLGTINHTLLSLSEMRRNGIDIMGVVMNGPFNEENRKAIVHYGNVRVLAQIEPIDPLDASGLRDAFGRSFVSFATI